MGLPFSTTFSRSPHKERPSDIVVALSGNPNVGKSTLFNALTGLNQHTGNWTGKTVETAKGAFIHNGRRIILVDLPGSYSLLSHSDEERVAENFILFGGADVNLVVCDAVALERNLNLLLQITEITPKTVLCVNLIDEATKKGIEIDAEKLSLSLGIPVIATAARNGTGLDCVCDAIIDIADSENFTATVPEYDNFTEQKIAEMQEKLPQNLAVNGRFAAIKVLQNDTVFFDNYKQKYGVDLSIFSENEEIIGAEKLVNGITKTAVTAADGCIKITPSHHKLTDLKADRIITSKLFGIPLMILLFGLIFWITITGANYPSTLLNNLFISLETPFYNLLFSIGTPKTVCELLVFGVYRVVAWIVSVMLPPMAIFFPLFTLLEDLGYLPRLAFNLDKCFQKCRTCGKQALTMCMGFGCNAAGVVGCRIIDSPREKLIAILTNSFVPCNGRFPTIITLITVFFIGVGSVFSNIGAALILCIFIILSVLLTFLASKILSRTILCGVPSSFTLELPPYRRPQILKVILRSVFDRTLFVLGRAVVAAIPAGFIIWFAANINVGDVTLLMYVANMLQPLANLLGLDGVILIAFILGLPANEIVLPIIIMAYSSGLTLSDVGNLTFVKELLVSNGWTILTALNVILFSLFHWPCATTLMTIKKETGSVKWMMLSAVLPTIFGTILCIITNFVYHLFA